MKKNILICILVLLGIAFSACRSVVAPDALVEAESELVADTPAATELETEADSAETSEPSTEMETEGLAAELSDACIECHTDQQTLTDTAKPEEDHESESEGEG